MDCLEYREMQKVEEEKTDRWEVHWVDWGLEGSRMRSQPVVEQVKEMLEAC